MKYSELDLYDQDLYNYIRNEIPICNKETFNLLKIRYPNNEKKIIYRGLNFSTKENYENFIKENFNHEKTIYINKGYKSFSENYEIALDFASYKKTYFPTEEIIREHEICNFTGENIYGYRGIIIKIEIDSNTAIDVNKSEIGIENEYIIDTDKYYECEIIEILKYGDLVKNIDINEYIQNSKDLKDPIFNYILINKSNLINEKSENHIFNMIQFKNYENDESILLNKKNFILYNQKKYKDGKAENIANFSVPDFFKYVVLDVFKSKKIQEKIKKISNDIMTDFFIFFLKGNNRNLNYDFLNLQRITPFCNNFIIDNYIKVLSEKYNSYDSINKKMREMLNKKVSEKEKREIINNGMNDLKNLFSDIINSNPLTENDIKKEKEKIEKTKKRLLKF